ncbi:PAS domain S-box protein [Candidatus Bipolaricaulota bacterium]|nr:PAS domain S-box protein [Candidatus Bipolaricaulota bacterium]
MRMVSGKRERRRFKGAHFGVSVAVYAAVALVLWGLEQGHEPTVVILGVTMALGVVALLLGWLGVAVGVGASLLLALPGLLGQPLVLWVVTGLLLLGVALIAGMAGHLWRQRTVKREVHHRLEACYGEEIFEDSLNIIHVVDREGNVIRRNRKSRELLGWPHKRSLHFTEYVHPQDIGRFKAELESLFERGELRAVELRFVSEGKRIVPVELQAKRVTGRVAVMEAQDRGEVVALERRLAEEEARYRHLIEDGIDTLDLGVILVDRQGHVLWSNRAVAVFFGLDRDGLIGLPAGRALDRFVRVLDSPEEFLARVQEAYRGGKPIDGYIVRVRPGPNRVERVLQYRSIPIETERYRGGRIDYYADITELKRLEEQLVQQKERLEEVNRKLKEFNSAVSHDLRKPALTALGYVQMILRRCDGELPQAVREDLLKVEGRLLRMEKLITDLLHFSTIRIDPVSFEGVDLHRLLQETKEDLASVLVGVNLQVAEDLPVVYGVPTLISELFANLIQNAVKFNDKALPVVEVGWKGYSGGAYLFYVRDNGPGIEAQYLEKIFGIFEKLDPNKEGTGAGLAICRRIVEEHGGRIWAESELGSGTTFYFTLPKVPARKGVESDAR